MPRNPNNPSAAGLRRRAEARLRDPRKHRPSPTGIRKLRADPVRLLHELEVHQIELEMQNAELQKARDELEQAVEKYTDLYEFAPVGYFCLDEQGRILELNLTGAALLGVERSGLIKRRLAHFLVPAGQREFMTFLEQVFAGRAKPVCEAELLKNNGAALWVNLHGACVVSSRTAVRQCRVAVSDITSLKQAQLAQSRLELLAVTNRELSDEIVRRQAVEAALRESEQHSRDLLEQSRRMQDQLRLLSRQLLLAQEDERKRISRELHDVVAQTLTSINVRLANLKKEALTSTKGLDRTIARTQELVLHSVELVHRFARELRPAALDDLGLVAALRTFLKTFQEETGIRVSLAAFAGVEKVDGDKRTVLYRVAQEALTNVARHGRASEAQVRFLNPGGAVCMEIQDNGQGFHPGGVTPAGKGKRLGLLGMRERLEMVGGTFSVQSAPGKGTTIQARVPLANDTGPGGKPAGRLPLT